MKKNRLFVLALVVILAMSALTACKKVKNPTKNDVIDALVDEKQITKEVSENKNFKVKIDDVDLNDDKDRATVECSTTFPDGSLNVVTEYEIEFKLRDSGSWKVKEVKQVSRKTELASGITDEEIKSILENNSVLVDSDYVYFNSEKTSYEIGKHTTDLKEKTDKVIITGTSKTNYEEIKFEVECTFTYTGSKWRKTDDKVISSSKDFLDAYKLEPTADQVYADMKAKDLSFTVLGRTYYLTQTGVTVTDITIGKAELQNSNAYLPVTCTVKCDDVAAKYELKLRYTYADEKWSYRSVNNSKLLGITCGAIGTWTGTHGTLNVTINVKDTLKENTSYLEAEVSGTTANGETYKYSAYLSRYNLADKTMRIYAVDWIQRPATQNVSKYSYSSGTIENGVFSYGSTYSFTKQGATTDKPTEAATEAGTQAESASAAN